MARAPHEHLELQCAYRVDGGSIQTFLCTVCHAQLDRTLADSPPNLKWEVVPPASRDNDERNIDLYDDDEVRAYCRELNTNEADLRAAVDAVGVRVRDVKVHLSRVALRRRHRNMP